MQAERNLRREGQSRMDRIPFDVGPATAEIRIAKTIDHCIRFDVAIIQSDVPIPALLQGDGAQFDSDDPRGIPARERTGRPTGQIRAPIIDRQAVDAALIESDVFDKLANQGNRKRFKMLVIRAARKREVLKGRGQAKILPLL